MFFWTYFVLLEHSKRNVQHQPLTCSGGDVSCMKLHFKSKRE